MSVLLLKSTAAPESDNYATVLSAAGIPALVINTLRFNFFAGALRDVRFADYVGVVFTSARAVEAFRSVLSGEGVSALRCFCVGLATADKARLVGFNPEGFESGNANDLANYIITVAGSLESRRVLFPCGSDRLDTIERRLKEAGFSVDARVVYSAEKDPGLETTLRHVLEKQSPRTIAFFSPSAVRHSIKVIKETGFRDLPVISIGRSTSEALRAEGVQHIVEAAKPNPSDFVDALRRV